MYKRYLYKIYDLQGNFLETLNPNIIKSDLRFTKNINGGLGQIQVKLNIPFNTIKYIQGQIIKVWEINELNQNGVLVYSGIIDLIQKQSTEFDEVGLIATGFGSFLSRVFYKIFGDYTFPETDDPGQIVKDLIDFFGTEYPGLITYGDDVVNVGKTATVDFDYTNLFDGINLLKDISDNYYWYVDVNGNIFFKEKRTTINHVFTYGKDIISIDTENDGYKIYNRLILERKDQTDIYEDQDSIDQYGLREKKENKTDIATQTDADDYGNNFLVENKSPINKLKIRVSNEYSYNDNFIVDDLTDTVDSYDIAIDSLRNLKGTYNVNPGDLCQIRNIENIEDLIVEELVEIVNSYDISIDDLSKSLNLTNLLINKVTYTPDFITIQFEGFDNLIDLIRQ